ncbi:hypothetical protein ACHAXA_010174 [Cyclostephanos tholiformis]|uniref:peptidylprolyl isomerase n=1 Tax=Cyclostephanos tholiformis TaxID=382380 RepID=A0ABD3RS78_9STRA
MAKFLSFGIFILCSSNTAAFSLSMESGSKVAQFGYVGSRRSFFSTACATVVGGTSILSRPEPSCAVTAKEIITTPSGIKYAVTKESSDKKPVAPYKGDFVAIDYTGYLASGQIFDATHSEGKGNSLLFKLGSGSVIPGLDEMVSQMVVGQKVQAIIPPGLAYGEKGVCLDDGECLIKPGSTLVYDIFLKRTSIPPP